MDRRGRVYERVYNPEVTERDVHKHDLMTKGKWRLLLKNFVLD